MQWFYINKPFSEKFNLKKSICGISVYIMKSRCIRIFENGVLSSRPCTSYDCKFCKVERFLMKQQVKEKIP